MPDRSVWKSTWREFRRAAQRLASLLRRAGVFVGIGVVYAGLAEVGFVGSTTNPLVSSIWPAAGLALVGFWKYGSWCWPAVAVSAFAINALNGAPLVAAAIIGVGSAAGPMVAAHALRRVDFAMRLERLRDGILLLAYGAVVGAAISAVVGATALGIAEGAPVRSIPGLVMTWWSGDALGIVLVAPLAFAWITPRGSTISGGRTELVLLVLAASGLALATFLSTERDLAWAAFPIVVWSALRFGTRGATSIAGLVAAMATISALAGRGAFAHAAQPEDLVASQLFLAALATSGLLLSAVWSEHRALLASVLEVEALRAVAEKLTGSGGWSWDPVTDRVICADGLHRVFGTSPLARGMRMQDFVNRVDPADRELVRTTIDNALRNTSGLHGEVHIVRADDGTTRTVESFGRVLAGVNGRPVLVGACLDVTKRKHVEVELRRTNNHLQALLDASPLAILELDRSGRVRSWSAGAERLFGWTEAEVLGAPNPIVPPDAAQEFDDMLERAFHGEVSHGLRAHRVTKLGVRLVVRLSCAPVRDHTGAVASAVTVLDDNTARERLASAVRRSEEELQNLFQAAPVGIYRKTTDGQLLMANRALLGLLGYSSERPLLSPRARHQLYHDPREREHISSAFAAGAESLAAVVALRRADGTAVRVQWDARAVRDADGRVRFLECFVRDLSERIAMEHALRVSRDRLSELSRQLIDAQEVERRAIARGLHDEVGQALTAVRLGLVALKGKWPGGRPPREFGDTIAAVDETRRAVLDLSLDLRPLILDDLGLEAALRWYVDSLGRRAGMRIRVVSQMAECRFDPLVETACYRIAQEALANVVRHADAGAVAVTLGATDQQLELVVEDDGGGFDVEAATRNSPDARLGLVGMTERAQLTGGRLFVESIRGRGTRITARFPLAPAAIEDVRRAAR